MNSNISTKTTTRDKIMVFALALIPRLILIFCFAGIFRTPMDEMSTISTGAYFGGKDWTALTKFAKFYYGGGFTILFAPLFRIIDNTEIVYLIMLSVCALLQSISAPISYHVMNRYMNIQDRRYLNVGALACSFMVVTRAMEVFNEHIIIGMLWISVWLLCKLVEDNKHKALYSVGIILVFSYLLTTHTRTKVIWIAFVIGCIVYRIVYKKWLVSLVPAIVSGVLGYWGAGQFNTMIKRVIWDWQEGEFLRNANVKVPIGLAELKNPLFWNSSATTIAGQINTVFVFTGGIAVVMLVILCCNYGNTIKEYFLKRKEAGEVSTPAYERYIIIISLIFVMCVGAVIAAQCITWSKRMMVALGENPFGSNAYGYKAVTYVRYMGPFLGPVFLCGLATIYHKKEEIRKYLLPAVTTLGIFHVLWIGFVLPHITNNKFASEVFVAFGWYKIKGDSGAIGAREYLLASIVMFIVFAITMVCYWKKKLLPPLIIVLLLLFYQYCYGAIFWDSAYAESYGERVDKSISLFMEISEEDKEIIPNTIYVQDFRKDVQRRVYTCQMYLSNYKVVVGRPKEDNEGNIVLSDKNDDSKLLERGYKVGFIDEKEYIYVNDDKYVILLKDKGVIFNE